jgi:hypothetical protein
VPGEWYSPGGPPGTTPRAPRKRPKWLIPAVAAAAVVAIVVALVVTLGSGSSNHGGSGSGPTTTPSHSASPQTTPTVGELQLSQLQVGDCVTGANLQLNKTTPWPKLSQAVPCTQAHTAEVFYANNNHWAKKGGYPGNATIKKDATAACNSAFQSYVGIAYSKSRYTLTYVVPAAATWPGGDRALHCMLYYATTAQPAGVTLHKSVKGAAE